MAACRRAPEAGLGPNPERRNASPKRRVRTPSRISVAKWVQSSPGKDSNYAVKPASASGNEAKRRSLTGGRAR